MAEYNTNENRDKPKTKSHGWKIAVAALAVLLAGALALTAFTAGVLVMRYLPQGVLGSILDNKTASPAAYTIAPQSTSGPATPSPSVAQIGGTNSLALGQGVDIPAIVKADGPAVVGVLNKVKNQANNNAVTDVTQGSGSGVIITTDGYIVTNNHVIDGADSIAVVMPGGEEVPAKLVGADTQTDLAVLKIDKTGLTAIPIGNSDNLLVGETVLAIGNPLGTELAGTVTAGILSAKNREIQIDGYKFTLLQTDAAINPGNSGGALVNTKGELIGINNLKSISAGTDQNGMPISAEGIGFAIPVNVAEPIIKQLMTSGSIQRPMFGISVAEISADQANFYKMDPGVYIQTLSQDGPAMKAGLLAGDRIEEVAGVKVATVTDLRDAISKYKIGDTVAVKVYRQNDKKELTVNVTFESSTAIKS